jgi:DNA-binding transcriptional ArsR family regulator
MSVETLKRRTRDEDLVQVYAALGEPTRLRIVRLLGEQSEGLSCGEIAERIGSSCSTLSHHLALLHHAGLVAWQKEGKFRRYALRREALDAHAPGVLIEDTKSR